MRIAQVSPLYESVPPKLYGGTERVVSYLTEELVRQGHDVTLFASGDSVTSAELVAPCQQSLRLAETVVDPLAYHFVMLDKVFKRVEEFDIIHFHIDYLHFPLSRIYSETHVTTLHGRLDMPDLVPLYRAYADMPTISISNSQREPLPWLNWQATVYHGLPIDLYTPHFEAGSYLAFLGRISPEKRVDRAIALAKQLDMPLRIAAKVDNADHEYFETEIEHLLDHPLVEFLGEIGEGEKEEFLGNAYALVFPIDWPEPFGLVMIEAMACGTPVIAFEEGSVPEVIDHGVTGYIVNTTEEAAEAIQNIPKLSRRICRKIFEERFSSEPMARNYLKTYRRVIAAQPKAAPRRLSLVANLYDSGNGVPVL